MSTMPTKNVGSAWPSAATVFAAVSTSVPLRAAAATPSGNATRRLRAIAKPASLSEFGKRSRRSSFTGRRARREVPKSPRAALTRKLTYCSGRGRSSPR
ncbi:MAG: hypothetical protein AUG87_13660 [Candidatus Rokubacteria bacterium 13_1_20CM_4_70_14]|nr:MAG: hypothetical protein AUG87_13660 [Candidatus Rokubacteria bacterium 13_1_20CM_4_70_14]